MSQPPPEPSDVPCAAIWSGWQLLSFSGLDGQTDWQSGAEARLLPDRLGVAIEDGRSLTLEVDTDDQAWSPLAVEHDRVVARVGPRAELTLGFATQQILLLDLRVPSDAPSAFQLRAILAGDDAGSVGVVCDPPGLTGDGGAIVAPGQTARLALSLAADTVNPAWLGRHLPPSSHVGGGQSAAEAKARAILRGAVMTPEGNFARPWILSQRRPPHGATAARAAVTWHTPLMALALADEQPTLAADLLLGTLAQQTPSGLLPDAIWPDGHTSDSGPPLLCWGFWRLYEHTGDRAMLATAVARLREGIRHPLTTRMLSRLGHAHSRGAQFMTWGRGDGAGMDNSPRFDLNEPFAAVDHTALCVNEIACLAKIIEAETPEHRREAVHVAWMGEELARDARDFFWDDGQAFFVDRYPDAEAVEALTVAGWLPLFAGLASDEQAQAMVTRHLGPGGDFATALPLPSLAQHDPRADQNRWRGAVFPALTPLVVEGLRRYGLDDLAAELRDRTLAAMERWYQRTGTFWEYYDALDRQSPADLPRGRHRGAFAEDGWSAAAYLVLLGDRARGGSA